MLTQIRAGQRVEPFETTRRRKDGTEIDVSLTVSPIRNAGGHQSSARRRSRGTSRSGVAPSASAASSSSGNAVACDEAVHGARSPRRFVADVGAVLTSSLDYSETLDRAVHLALPRLGDYRNVRSSPTSRAARATSARGHVVQREVSRSCASSRAA